MLQVYRDDPVERFAYFVDFERLLSVRGFAVNDPLELNLLIKRIGDRHLELRFEDAVQLLRYGAEDSLAYAAEAVAREALLSGSKNDRIQTFHHLGLMVAATVEVTCVVPAGSSIWSTLNTT